MRRIFIVSVALLFASGCAALASVFDVSEAREAATEPASTHADPFFQVVDNDTTNRFSAPGWKKQVADDQTYGENYVTAGSNASEARFRMSVP